MKLLVPNTSMRLDTCTESVPWVFENNSDVLNQYDSFKSSLYVVILLHGERNRS